MKNIAYVSLVFFIINLVNGVDNLCFILWSKYLNAQKSNKTLRIKFELKSNNDFYTSPPKEYTYHFKYDYDVTIKDFARPNKQNKGIHKLTGTVVLKRIYEGVDEIIIGFKGRSMMDGGNYYIGHYTENNDYEPTEIGVAYGLSKYMLIHDYSNPEKSLNRFSMRFYSVGDQLRQFNSPEQLYMADENVDEFLDENDKQVFKLGECIQQIKEDKAQLHGNLHIGNYENKISFSSKNPMDKKVHYIDLDNPLYKRIEILE